MIPKWYLFLEIALKKPYHGVKGKGLPSALRITKKNTADWRGGGNENLYTSKLYN